MKNWTLVVAVAALVVPLAERFYTRFYPEPETQKRHLKAIAGLGIDCASIGFQIWSLIGIAHEPMPTTASHVLKIAVMASIAVGSIFLIIALRVMSHFGFRLLGLMDRHLNNTSQIIDLILDHDNVLRRLSEAHELTTETQDDLRKLLNRR